MNQSPSGSPNSGPPLSAPNSGKSLRTPSKAPLKRVSKTTIAKRGKPSPFHRRATLSSSKSYTPSNLRHSVSREDLEREWQRQNQGVTLRARRLDFSTATPSSVTSAYSMNDHLRATIFNSQKENIRPRSMVEFPGVSKDASRKCRSEPKVLGEKPSNVQRGKSSGKANTESLNIRKAKKHTALQEENVNLFSR